MSSARFMDDKSSKLEDAEMGLYLLKVIERFRSIEKGIFSKLRNEKIKRKLEKENLDLSEFYDEILEKDAESEPDDDEIKELYEEKF